MDAFGTLQRHTFGTVPTQASGLTGLASKAKSGSTENGTWETCAMTSAPHQPQ